MKPLRLGILAATVVLSGCVVAPAEPYYGPVYREPVYMAPPPPRVEYPPPAPALDFVWIDGYWNWSGRRHEWVPGRWEAPRHGERWVPHRWEHEGRGWRQYGGHWERRRD